MHSANEYAADAEANADTGIEKAVETVARHPLWIPIAGALGFLMLGFAWLLLPLDEWLPQFGDWLKGLGIAGVAVFALVYAFGTLLLLPGTPLTILAAIAYGWWALPLVWTA